MKGLGYALLVLAVVGCWIVWQIVRRASAGVQAVISPERYAIQKVEQMQDDVLFRETLLTPNNPYPVPMDRWNALVRFDEDIRPAADKLRPYGEKWVAELGHAYFALNEDRQYLPRIVSKLLDEAEQEKERLLAQAEQEREQRWAKEFRTCGSELLTEESLDILRRAEKLGFALTVEKGNTIAATRDGTTYLRTNFEIRRFGKFLKRPE